MEDRSETRRTDRGSPHQLLKLRRIDLGANRTPVPGGAEGVQAIRPLPERLAHSSEPAPISAIITDNLRLVDGLGFSGRVIPDLQGTESEQ